MDLAYTTDKYMQTAKAQETEPIQIFNLADLPDNIVPNLKWMIPLCLDENIENPVFVETDD